MPMSAATTAITASVVDLRRRAARTTAVPARKPIPQAATPIS